MTKPPRQLPEQDDFDPNKRAKAEGEKATQFDGDPSPKGSKSKAFKPEDDTPFTLKKKSGPDVSQKKD